MLYIISKWPQSIDISTRGESSYDTASVSALLMSPLSLLSFAYSKPSTFTMYLMSAYFTFIPSWLRKYDGLLLQYESLVQSHTGTCCFLTSASETQTWNLRGRLRLHLAPTMKFSSRKHQNKWSSSGIFSPNPLSQPAPIHWLPSVTSSYYCNIFSITNTCILYCYILILSMFLYIYHFTPSVFFFMLRA
jgi:hypothetical protein